MKLRLKMNVKFASNHRLDQGFEVESDEDGAFPDYVNENRDLFEEVAGAITPVKTSTAGPSGIVNSPAKPVALKKEAPVVTPKAQESTTIEKVGQAAKPKIKTEPAVKVKPADKTKSLIKRNKV